VSHVQGQVGCSERRACAVLGQHRSTQRYERRVAPDESALVGRIEEIVRSQPRWAPAWCADAFGSKDGP
jgi:hypothetical protein